MFRFILLFILVTAVFAEHVDFFECGRDPSTNCDINEVTLSPCPNVSRKNPCKLKKGVAGQLEFKYTPKFACDKLEAHLYWVNPLNIDLPLPGMDTDGCHSTTCPLVDGQENTFKYNLTMEKYFPSMKYNVKALLKRDDNSKCCFEFTIKITN